MFGKNKMKYLLSKLIKKIQISSVKNSKISRKSRIGSGNNLIKVNISNYSYIGNDCIFFNVNIGSFCSIANNCIIGGGDHPLNWVSTSPIFYSGKNVFKKNFSENIFLSDKTTYIGNDVWIGNNVLIKAGVTIGNGAVIGMGSIVTKNVGDYEIWAGNPAKLIRKRFSDKEIIELKKIQWWNFSEENLKKNSENMNDIDKYFKNIEKEGQ